MIQSLLKAELGLGVESWGGPGDQGKDAYFEGPLKYPSRTEESGPFLFQAKFVQAANAAGANPRSPLLRAVQAECRMIQRRISQETWPGVRHYVLLTNARPSPQTRDEIRDAVTSAGGEMSVHIHGGLDVCDILDRQPNLRRAFPQLLSLRDLESLLAETVAKEILERSRIAIDCAADLAPVFVPTRAYDRVRYV